MSASRMKNLILLILALCALGLLAVVVPDRLTQNRQQRQMLAELKTLYASFDLTLDLPALPRSPQLYSVELPNPDALSAARALLGQDASSAGDEDRYEAEYTAAHGTLRVTRSGSFQAQLTGGRPVGSIDSAAARLLRTLGYQVQTLAPAVRTDDGAEVVRATQKLLGVPVFEDSLDVIYRDGVLSALDGVFYTGSDSATRVSQTPGISCADALTQFLASRDALGWVGSRVSDVTQGYLPTETASASVWFVPTWRIETDTGSFYVSGVTREVRAAP